MKLILFDIDGTLLDSGEAGTRSLNLAFEEIFSIRNALEGISMAGKTDIQIMKEGLKKHGLDTFNGNILTLLQNYIEHLHVQIENPRRRLKPAVRESLEALDGMDDVYLGLLTGNIEAGARIKLNPFALNHYFPLGAFGDDNEDRNRLLPIAVKRFKALYGNEIEYRDCIVIGDTPKDIECAKIYGAYSVAVATGPYPHESLAGLGADVLLRDMSKLDYAWIVTQG